jgi:hypothetical protein
VLFKISRKSSCLRARFAVVGLPLKPNEDNALRRGVPQQGLVVRIDRFVALAGSLSQAVHVENLDFAPRVFDHARPLEGVRYGGDACAPYPEHFGKKFLCE